MGLDSGGEGEDFSKLNRNPLIVAVRLLRFPIAVPHFHHGIHSATAVRRLLMKLVCRVYPRLSDRLGDII